MPTWPSDGGFAEVEQVGVEPEQDGFGFGVAEAGVEFEHFGAMGGEDEAGEEDAGEGCSFGGHAFDDAPADVLEQPGGHFGRDEVVGADGAHAAGVGSGVAFADALVILREGERDGGLCRRRWQKKEISGPDEHFFNDDAFGLACEQVAVEEVVGGGEGLIVRVAKEDTLAGGQAIGLDDDAGREFFEGSAHLVERLGDGVGGGRDAPAAHEALR